jgi:tRNA(Ile)-lysidine synthase
MNEDERFTRVRIRKVVMPLLSELNPRIVETLARTSHLLHAGEHPPETPQTETLNIAELATLERLELYSRLRAWLRQIRGGLRGVQLKHIEGIERLILSRKSGKSVELPGGGRVSRHRGRLTFSNIKVEK